MNVQLLLLLALAGPFCAFTHASPTGSSANLEVTNPPTQHSQETDVPTSHTIAHAATDAPKVDLTLVTGHPPTAPAALPEEVQTVTATAEPAPSVNEEHVVETDAPTLAPTAAQQPRITDPPAPAVETAAPTHPAEAEDQTEATGASEANTGDNVVLEEGSMEGLSSGQVVGIVIGALLAVVIVIAVVIAAVRRMGKYSP